MHYPVLPRWISSSLLLVVKVVVVIRLEVMACLFVPHGVVEQAALSEHNKLEIECILNDEFDKITENNPISYVHIFQ